MESLNRTTPERSFNYNTARASMVETERSHSPATTMPSHLRPTKAFLHSIDKSNRAKFKIDHHLQQQAEQTGTSLNFHSSQQQSSQAIRQHLKWPLSSAKLYSRSRSPIDHEIRF